MKIENLLKRKEELELEAMYIVDSNPYGYDEELVEKLMDEVYSIIEEIEQLK